MFWSGAAFLPAHLDLRASLAAASPVTAWGHGPKTGRGCARVYVGWRLGVRRWEDGVGKMGLLVGEPSAIIDGGCGIVGWGPAVVPTFSGSPGPPTECQIGPPAWRPRVCSLVCTSPCAEVGLARRPAWVPARWVSPGVRV